jgi:hypothetical protein
MTEKTTKKFNSFISRPLQDCSITDIPGAGVSSVAKLIEAGMDTPEKLMGVFLVSCRDTETMKKWLVSACSLRAHEAGRIATALERKSQSLMVC